MSNMNLEPIDKQLPALQKTAKDLVNLPFGDKEIREYTKEHHQLRNLDADLRSAGLGYIISRTATLSGFKGEIPEINKDDISELLLTRFKTISLNELNFAFKLDRHGYHGEPTQHYQLFNAEYVARVLNRYLKYKNEIRIRPRRVK